MIETSKTRIVLVGAHGVGKSTLANRLSEIYTIPIVESVARVCKDICEELGEDLKNRDISYQKMVLELSKWDWLRWKDVYCVMTRSPLDPIAYSLVKGIDVSLDYEMDMEGCEFFFIEPEFEIEDDGVRPLDKTYQIRVSNTLKKLCKRYNIKYTKLTGSIDERVEQVGAKIF